MNTTKPYQANKMRWCEGMPLIDNLREANPYSYCSELLPIDELVFQSIIAMEEVDSAIIKLMSGE